MYKRSKKIDNMSSGILALWLTLILFVNIASHFYFNGEETSSGLYADFLALIWPFPFFFAKKNFRESIRTLLGNHKFFLFMFLYMMSSFLSIINSPLPLISLGYFAGTFIGLLYSYMFMSSMASDEIIKGFVVFSFFAALILVAFAAHVGLDDKGRLSSEIYNPNPVGLVCVSVIMAALLSRNKIMFLFAISTAIVLYYSDSRTSIMALFIGLASWAVFKRKRGFSSLTMSCIFFGIAFLMVYVFFNADSIIRAIDNLFAVNDKWRGVGTGFTGRMEAWKEALSIFWSSPLFGVGFRMHEHYMTTASSAHNGYLAVLADTGVTGSVVLFGFIWLSLFNYLNCTRDVLDFWAIGIICGYLFVGLFERYILNVGNPTSLIVMMMLVRGFSLKSRRPRQHEEKVDEYNCNVDVLPSTR
ncbi:MAG: O-antigen ligase family protein [Nitrospirota bacterium]